MALTPPNGATATYQWALNGGSLSGATSTNLTVSNVQPASTGLYTLVVNSNSTVSYSAPAILGLLTSLKVVGTGIEFSPDILHQNGTRYDQLLLNGSATAFTADAGQVTRISYIDLSDDIVQVEFFGAGTVSLTLDNPSGPAVATKYNQSVSYMKGHAKITVVGGNENSHLSIFTVGTQTAVNQALFPAGVTYDGVADVAVVSISSPTNRFGSVRMANASFVGTSGVVGLYAPNVRFGGPVYLQNVAASDSAFPMIVTGAIDGTGEVLVAGGNLSQPNGRAVAIGSLSRIRMGAGSTSHGVANLPARANAGVIERDGTNVTSSVITGP